MKKILVIPDAHVEPGQDMSRFLYAGKTILTEMPDIIINLGDFNTMSSLSHWDENKRLLMEGRRYKADMEAGAEAVRLLSKPLRTYNYIQKIHKKKQYNPLLIWIDGNHEEWANRYVETHPQMEDIINPFRDQKVTEYFQNVEHIPYRGYKVVEGVAFTHSPIAANNQAVSGKYAIARALELFDMPVVFGHTHRLETMAVHAHGNDKVRRALTCGCYWEKTPDYILGAQLSAWKGLTVLNMHGEGEFDFKTISLEELKRRWENECY